jgi:hypothetical protein
MADYAATTPRREEKTTRERGADWPLALVFFFGVASMYAVIAYALYLVVT